MEFLYRVNRIFFYIYILFTFITWRLNIVIYSNREGREIRVFFHFSTYLIRAIFLVYKSVEIYYLIKLKGLSRLSDIYIRNALYN